MVFTVSEFRELLEQQPTWGAKLRRWVLTEELLALPQTVHELAEAQRRTEERLGQMAGHMDTLTQRVEQLTVRMEQFTVRMEQLAETQLRMGSDLERLKGSDLERRYRERAHAYFSRLLRRTHVLSGDALSRRLDDAVLQGQLTEAEADAVLQANMVVRGRHREDGTEVYLVVEVSWGIGLSNVQRASERAALLARTINAN